MLLSAICKRCRLVLGKAEVSPDISLTIQQQENPLNTRTSKSSSDTSSLTELPQKDEALKESSHTWDSYSDDEIMV